MIFTVPMMVVAGLLLLFLLMLADKFPQYTVGFMVLVLFGVVVTHSDVIVSLFNISPGAGGSSGTKGV